MDKNSEIKCSNCGKIVTNPVLNAYEKDKEFCNRCGHELNR